MHGARGMLLLNRPSRRQQAEGSWPAGRSAVLRARARAAGDSRTSRGPVWGSTARSVCLPANGAAHGRRRRRQHECACVLCNVCLQALIGGCSAHPPDAPAPPSLPHSCEPSRPASSPQRPSALPTSPTTGPRLCSAQRWLSCLQVSPCFIPPGLVLPALPHPSPTPPLHTIQHGQGRGAWPPSADGTVDGRGGAAGQRAGRHGAGGGRCGAAAHPGALVQGHCCRQRRQQQPLVLSGCRVRHRPHQLATGSARRHPQAQQAHPPPRP